MVITKLLGGLGNQMFQAAAGLAVAARSGASLRFDVAELGRYGKHHGFQFRQVFRCDPAVATSWDRLRMLGIDIKRATWGGAAIGGKDSSRSKRWIRQPTHDWWPGFEAVHSPCYLSGFWQSEKFFSNVRAEVRAQFSFREPQDADNSALAQRILACTAVSLHARRGDYTREEGTKQFHGTCPWSYYEAAVQYISERVPRAVFFAFSDDPAWLSAHLGHDPRFTVVDINRGTRSYLDMYLMSLCQHHIIANSTFSWWGAYLGRNPDRIVVAPKQWFAGDPDGISDIYCRGWVVL